MRESGARQNRLIALTVGLALVSRLADAQVQNDNLLTAAVRRTGLSITARETGKIKIAGTLPFPLAITEDDRGYYIFSSSIDTGPYGGPKRPVSLRTCVEGLVARFGSIASFTLAESNELCVTARFQAAHNVDSYCDNLRTWRDTIISNVAARLKNEIEVDDGTSDELVGIWDLEQKKDPWVTVLIAPRGKRLSGEVIKYWNSKSKWAPFRIQEITQAGTIITVEMVEVRPGTTGKTTMVLKAVSGWQSVTGSISGTGYTQRTTIAGSKASDTR